MAIMVVMAIIRELVRLVRLEPIYGEDEELQLLVDNNIMGKREQLKVQRNEQEVIRRTVIMGDWLFELISLLGSTQFFLKLSPQGHTQHIFPKKLKEHTQFGIQSDSNQ